MTDWEVWASGVLAGIGAPISHNAVDALWAWSGAESLPRDRMSWCNPLDTTEPWPGAVPMNSVGVRRYASTQDGIAATTMTLKNGHYPTIVAYLRTGVDRSTWSPACAELGTWGTGCGWINQDYGPLPGTLGADMDVTDPNFQALIWRVETLISNAATVPAGPTKGEANALKASLAASGAAVDLSPVLNAIAALKASQDATAADVATIKLRIEKDLAP